MTAAFLVGSPVAMAAAPSAPQERQPLEHDGWEAAGTASSPAGSGSAGGSRCRRRVTGVDPGSAHLPRPGNRAPRRLFRMDGTSVQAVSFCGWTAVSSKLNRPMMTRRKSTDPSQIPIWLDLRCKGGTLALSLLLKLRRRDVRLSSATVLWC